MMDSYDEQFLKDFITAHASAPHYLVFYDLDIWTEISKATTAKLVTPTIADKKSISVMSNFSKFRTEPLVSTLLLLIKNPPAENEELKYFNETIEEWDISNTNVSNNEPSFYDLDPSHPDTRINFAEYGDADISRLA